MNIVTISDLKSIRSGAKKAKRDYRKIMAYIKEHRARHEADEDYDCGPFRHDFWERLGKDVHPRISLYEAAAYKSAMNRYQEREEGKSKAADKGADTGPGFSFLPIEMDGTETPEQFLNKIRQAIRDQVVIDQLDKSVSETAKPTEPVGSGPADKGPKHKKGGK